MRIYTVTYLHRNYGSALQAFALQSILKGIGVTPVVIQKSTTKKHSAFYQWLLKIWYLLLPQKDYSLAKRIQLAIEDKKSSIKYKKIDSFILNKIQSLSIVDEKEFFRNVDNSDIFLAGSDQIWGTADKKLSSWYTFQWLDDSHTRYSYAASIGQAVLADNQIEDYVKGLASFKTISLREKQAVELLTPFFKDSIRQDLDPTLLCDGTFWKKIASPRLVRKPYIFVYRLRPNEDVIDISRKLAKEKGFKIVYVGLYSSSEEDVECVYDAGVEDFLSYILYAEAVVTNSFHGTVFSILMEKPFLSVKIDTTGSRVESLLELLGLKSQHISTIASNYSLNIDYSKVNSILRTEREKSINYLRSVCCCEKEQ